RVTVAIPEFCRKERTMSTRLTSVSSLPRSRPLAGSGVSLLRCLAAGSRHFRHLEFGVAALQVQGHVVEPEQHRHFHKRTDDRGECAPLRGKMSSIQDEIGYVIH